MMEDTDNDKTLRGTDRSYLAEINNPMFLLDVHFLSAITRFLGRFSLEFQKHPDKPHQVLDRRKSTFPAG